MTICLLGDNALEEFLSGHGVFLDVRPGWGARGDRQVHCGENVSVERFVGFYGGGPIVSMGAFSYSQSVLVEGMVVGRYCSIGDGLLVEKNRPVSSAVTTSNVLYERGGPVMGLAAKEMLLSNPDSSFRRRGRAPVIGNDVWVGRSVYLARDVRVGDGAILCDGCAVIEDVPPFAVVSGNPARVQGLRFDSEVVEVLLKFPWWCVHPGDLRDYLAGDVAEMTNFVRDRWFSLKKFEPTVMTSTMLKEWLVRR